MAIQFAPQGGEFRVNTYTSGDQYYPSATSLADGGFVVTWSSQGQDDSDEGVYCQLYSGDGSRVAEEFRVNTYTTSYQTGPSITSLADGGFVVTWTSGGQDSSDDGVYGQVYSGDGSSVGSEFRVNTCTTGRQFTTSLQDVASVTSLADGGFVVTWTSDGQDGSSLGVYGQVYSGDGSRVGGEFRVNTYTSSHQVHRYTTSLADGGFVVTWISDGQDSSDYGVYGQIYGGDGSRVGGEFRVNTYTTGGQSEPSVTSLADGGFAVTWSSGGQDGSSSGVYGQVYSGDGTRVGGEFRVNSYTTGYQGYPSATSLADGGFVVTWGSNRLLKKSGLDAV
jgi:hypothetical protein